MDFKNYLDQFQKATGQLDKKLLYKKQIEVAVGVVLNCVFLKLYKKSWVNPLEDPLTAETRIFFSVWVSDSTLQAQTISYNIHALKLRKLKGYAIESRKFADLFRVRFIGFAHKWQNVSVKYGPLTLMEGWVKFEESNFQHEVLKLANNFLEIEHLIDKTLIEFRK